MALLPLRPARLPFLLSLVLTSIGFPLMARAERPFVTEAAEVLGPGDCEVELAHERLRLPDDPRSNATALQWGCAVPHVRAQLSVSAVRLSEAGRAASGLSLGGKWQLWEGRGAAITLAGGTAAVEEEAGRRRFDEAFLIGVASIEATATWTFHAHAGVHGQRHQRRALLWAVAAEHAPAEHWRLGAETYRDGATQRWVAGVLRWQATDSLSLDTSLARAVHGGGRMHSVGAKWGF